MGLKPRLSPELIERFRTTGIRLDRQGRFWHEGAEIEHPGLRRALLRWLDLRADGRPILRIDSDRYAYVDVQDAHLLVLAVRLHAAQVVLTLNDGTEEELECASLRVGDDHALYCAVRQGKLEARFTQAAYYKLAEHIEELGDGFGLRLGRRIFVIGTRERKRQPEAGAT